MKKQNLPSPDRTYDLEHFFSPSSVIDIKYLIRSDKFERLQWDLSDQSSYILDKFPDFENCSCCFLRLSPEQGLNVRFTVHGGHQLLFSASGGWILKALNDETPSYWIPQVPVLRTFDSFRRMLSQETVSIAGLKTSSQMLELEFKLPAYKHFDIALWRIHPTGIQVLEELEQPLAIEKQPIFFWTSLTTYKEPADLYLYLVHGLVYTNRFIWPRNWKICSELDAYGLYVTFNGLECATGKMFYTLFKRQLVLSVITRQADNGGWYHGEWTKYMESHYRFLNGAMLLLEAAYSEYPEDSIRSSLEKGGKFLSSKTDNTDLGLWFLHDSLEDSREMMEEMCRVNGSNWIQKPVLGKAATNKLILNTHVDTIVSLEYYRQVTGDDQFRELVDSARVATRGVLALRPAEFLYRLIYRAIKLTILPEVEARKLPVALRALKRLTWKYIAPNLYRIKNIFPRLVMPDGFIERHLGMGHYDISYHPINVLDLTRLWRCFPEEDFAQVIDNAVKVVADCNIMEFWAEKKPRNKSLVEMVDALYHLCTLKQDTSYRQLLARGVMTIEDWKIGLPPALVGGDPEAVKVSQRVPCPSPTDARLRVVNLSHGDHLEILVINPTSSELKLEWEDNTNLSFSWFDTNGQPVQRSDLPLHTPSRSWLWGKNQV